jgi:geranylgeranyl diphosphate synthase type I
MGGQFLDVVESARSWEGVPARERVERAERVIRFKSAKYTVEHPLLVGGTLAGASPQLLASYSSYGLPLGEAFQLRDDLLGVFGDPDVTGKPAGDDLTEGKRTVLVALALERAPAEDAKLLDDRLGTPLSAQDVQRLRQVIVRSGAPGEVEERIRRLTRRSVAALEKAPVTEESREVLRGLATAATQRVL